MELVIIFPSKAGELSAIQEASYLLTYLAEDVLRNIGSQWFL